MKKEELEKVLKEKKTEEILKEKIRENKVQPITTTEVINILSEIRPYIQKNVNRRGNLSIKKQRKNLNYF